MNSHSPVTSLPRTGRRPRRGFTFMEILFAVMILGIGFIMVAAMFPAALKQTQGNIEENEFNVLCRTAAQDMENLAYSSDPEWAMYIKANPPAAGSPVSQPPRLLDRLTGWVATDANQPISYDPGGGAPPANTGRPVPFSFHDPRLNAIVISFPNSSPEYVGTAYLSALWDLVRGNMIISDKRQDAWVALWSRPKKIVNSQPVAGASVNLFIFPVRSRSKPQYDPYVNVPGSNPAVPNPACDLTYSPANLEPALVTFNYYPPPSGSTNNPSGVFEIVALRSGAGATIQTTLTGSGSVPAANPIADGCYVVISDSSHQAGGTYPGKYNGLIFKIGNEVADQSGKDGTSGGQFWSVAQIINFPSEQPFNISNPTQIGTDLQRGGASQIMALVVGRQPDPADAIQHSDAIRKGQPDVPLNRSGPAQELGYFPWSVVVK